MAAVNKDWILINLIRISFECLYKTSNYISAQPFSLKPVKLADEMSPFSVDRMLSGPG